MTKREIDPYTGVELTGHQWDGIKELNTPVPKLVYWFLSLGAVVCVILWVLYPSWPGVSSYTKGVLGVDQWSQIEDALETGASEREEWRSEIASADFETLSANPEIKSIVKNAGSVLFNDNCAACHGVGGGGNNGYPSLIDDDWIWGGTPDDIYQTLRAGINSSHSETRFSQMMAFGEMQVLSRDDILKLSEYVRTLSKQDNQPAQPEATALFEVNCASCHGITGEGEALVGAPNLTDDVWLYGGDPSSVYETIYFGRNGHMPHWDERLDDNDLKLLTLYVLGLSEQKSD